MMVINSLATPKAATIVIIVIVVTLSRKMIPSLPTASAASRNAMSVSKKSFSALHLKPRLVLTSNLTMISPLKPLVRMFPKPSLNSTMLNGTRF
jgi:hypothetical protein